MKEIIMSPGTAAYEFDELAGYSTAVFYLERACHDFLIDTFCGPDAMAAVLEARKRCGSGKPLIIVNTHYHWDHVWGNSAFKSCDIAAHSLCAQRLEESWEEQLLENGVYYMGERKMCLPGILFDEALKFPEDGIILRYTPGHTDDCISIFDEKERMLFAGDNLELPLIHIEDPDLNAYENTLRQYLDWQPEHVFASHTTCMGRKDIEDALAYIEGVKHGMPPRFSDPAAQLVHLENMKFLACCKRQ